jgi:hypothetical protein
VSGVTLTRGDFWDAPTIEWPSGGPLEHHDGGTHKTTHNDPIAL